MSFEQGPAWQGSVKSKKVDVLITSNCRTVMLTSLALTLRTGPDYGKTRHKVLMQINLMQIKQCRRGVD
jgi:hypothetical protein